MMFLKSKVLLSVLALSLLAVPRLAAHAEDALPFSVKPVQAFQLSVGAKRALGYYLANNGTCDLTVLLSDVSYPDDGIIPSASRVGVQVAAGTSAKVDTIDGKTMSFSCSKQAERMTVNVMERLAFSPAAAR